MLEEIREYFKPSTPLVTEEEIRELESRFEEDERPYHYIDNCIITSRYTVLNFVPR
jgi:hypothetical protein